MKKLVITIFMLAAILLSAGCNSSTNVGQFSANETLVYNVKKPVFKITITSVDSYDRFLKLLEIEDKYKPNGKYISVTIMVENLSSEKMYVDGLELYLADPSDKKINYTPLDNEFTTFLKEFKTEESMFELFDDLYVGEFRNNALEPKENPMVGLRQGVITLVFDVPTDFGTEYIVKTDKIKCQLTIMKDAVEKLTTPTFKELEAKVKAEKEAAAKKKAEEEALAKLLAEQEAKKKAEEEAKRIAAEKEESLIKDAIASKNISVEIAQKILEKDFPTTNFEYFDTGTDYLGESVHIFFGDLGGPPYYVNKKTGEIHQYEGD